MDDTTVGLCGTFGNIIRAFQYGYGSIVPGQFPRDSTTGYTGTDPALLSTNGLTPGVDNGVGYPETRVVTLGATVTF